MDTCSDSCSTISLMRRTTSTRFPASGPSSKDALSPFASTVVSGGTMYLAADCVVALMNRSVRSPRGSARHPSIPGTKIEVRDCRRMLHFFIVPTYRRSAASRLCLPAPSEDEQCQRSQTDRIEHAVRCEKAPVSGSGVADGFDLVIQ